MTAAARAIFWRAARADFARSISVRQLQTISRSCLYKLLLKPSRAAKGNLNRHNDWRPTMSLIKLPHIHSFRNRHGTLVSYFRKRSSAVGGGVK